MNMGVVRPLLVAMLSDDAEPKYYAGLALLKLADNFENHLKAAFKLFYDWGEPAA